MMVATDEIPIISSLHGRTRRSQRDITKRDLQAAVKYGTKEKGFPHPQTRERRWKYTHNDVVYITDYTSTREITSWATEFPPEVIDLPSAYNDQYLETKRRLKAYPKQITSHTVLVVDMSASMKKADMNGYKTRARGVYFNLAEEFVAARLHPVECGMIGINTRYTDVVTLIEMKDRPIVMFEAEPISWNLYNRFIERALANDASNHGNYFVSIASAFHYLVSSANQQPKCALCLFIFSDGKPSDYTTGLAEFPSNLYDIVRHNASLLSQRLTFSCYGFGKESEFEVLNEMVTIAKACGAVKSEFANSYLDPGDLVPLISQPCVH